MTEIVKKQLQILRSKEYRNARVSGIELRERYQSFDNTDIIKNAERFAFFMEAQEPVFHGENDVIGFNRYTQKTMVELWGDHFGNLTIDYPMILSGGLCGILDKINERYATADETAKRFYDGVRISFEACFRNAEKYRKAAKESGKALEINRCNFNDSVYCDFLKKIRDEKIFFEIGSDAHNTSAVQNAAERTKFLDTMNFSEEYHWKPIS